MRSTETSINHRVQDIFNENKINDLKRFMTKRQQLNSCNMKLRYLHYVMHYSSILITTIAASYQEHPTDTFVKMIWVGLTMNILSSLIGSFEKMNKSVSNKLLSDIYKIKSNTYIDECEMVDSFRETSSTKSNNTDSNKKHQNNEKVVPV